MPARARALAAAAALILTTAATTRIESLSPRVQRDQCVEMFARGYVPGRSGQIFLVAKRGSFFLSRSDTVFYRFMHGSPWSYDVRIPLLLHGAPFVRRGSFARAARQQDVAPTILALLGQPSPSTMTGRVLSEALAEGRPLPSAILLLVLDGLGVDTWNRLEASLPTLARLRRSGAWFSNAAVDYLPSVTSAGHATIATGTDPRFHGIHGNATFDNRTGRQIGPFDRMSPSDYRVPSLADHWSLLTAGRAVVVAQGASARATVALAGQGDCAVNGREVIVAMFDESRAGWTTNDSCFRLPAYLAQSSGKPLWEAASSTWRGHRVDSGKTLLRSGLYPAFQMRSLAEILERESVGKDSVPDLLLVNSKTPDYVSHQYGPGSPEMAAALQALDEQIGALFTRMDASVGRGRYVVVVTADHGMPPEPEGAGQARWYVEDVADELHARFDPEKRLLLDFEDSNCQLHVDPQRLARLGLTLGDLARYLEGRPYVLYAITENEVRAKRLR